MKRGWRNSEEWAQRIILVVAFWIDWREDSWEISRLQLNMAEYFEREKMHLSGLLLCETLVWRAKRVKMGHFLFGLSKALG